MKKYLVDIEFRYTDKKHDRDTPDHVSRTITFGVFDTLDEANNVGNKQLEILESRFKLHKFPRGHYAAKERFSKTGGCFGSGKYLVTDLAYLQTPFNFFAHVRELHFDDLDETITDILSAVDRYKSYCARQDSLNSL